MKSHWDHYVLVNCVYVLSNSGDEVMSDSSEQRMDIAHVGIQMPNLVELNGQEATNSSPAVSPTNPTVADTDGDGTNDGG